MEKVIQFNLCNYGSTGMIMRGIGRLAEKRGYDCYYVYPRSRLMKEKERHDIYACSLINRKIADMLAYYTGFRGIWLTLSTWKLLRRIKKLNPSVIHLHNLHNTYINLPLLFDYCKRHKVKVIWTLHDCWPFTGQCPYFTIAKCEKWKTGCYDCPQINVYPSSCVDRTENMWNLKKNWFTGVKDMTIVTPSQWLADLVGQSYLKEYPVKVIHNGIDLSIFKPTESDFRKKYGIDKDRYILLGVAFSWGKRKGLDVFVELSKKLDIGKYKIILVGIDDEIEKELPESIISIHKTQDQRELAEIYTAADLFVNPTREENYPTVNMESIACGTPVLTFRTGGSPEMLDETCGSVVECDDIDTMEHEIIRISIERPYSKEACLERAKMFDKDRRFQEYIDLL